MKVKFAHISDVHLGAWRDERLNELGYKAFEKTVNNVIDEEVDFVIISGDLYDVSNPKVEVLLDTGKLTAGLGEEDMKNLKEGDIVQLERRYFASVDKIQKNKITFWYLHK